MEARVPSGWMKAASGMAVMGSWKASKRSERRRGLPTSRNGRPSGIAPASRPRGRDTYGMRTLDHRDSRTSISVSLRCRLFRFVAFGGTVTSTGSSIADTSIIAIASRVAARTGADRRALPVQPVLRSITVEQRELSASCLGRIPPIGRSSPIERIHAIGGQMSRGTVAPKSTNSRAAMPRSHRRR